MAYTPEQKNKLREILNRAAPKGTSIETLKSIIPKEKDYTSEFSFARNEIDSLKKNLNNIPLQFEGKIQSVLTQLSSVEETSFTSIERIASQMFQSESAIRNLEDITKTNTKDIDYLKKEVDNLWWTRTAPSGSPNGGSVFLSTLNDVSVTGISSGQTLVYDSTVNRFIPGTSGAGQTVTLKTGVFDVATANANSTKIQAAISKKGLITLQADVPNGIAPINTTFIVPSDTTVSVSSGLTLKNYKYLTGSNVPLFVNENWQSTKVTATNGVSDFGSGWYVFNVTGVTVTPTYGAIYTNSGANFLVISTSITAGSGTVTCYSTGQPSTSGILTKTSGTGDATVTYGTRVEIQRYLQGQRTATVDFGSNAHGLSNGSWFTLKGDTTKKYLGIWQVLNVIDANKVSFSIPGDTAGMGSSAGTITTQKADANIYFNGGGTIDYNGTNNQADYGYNCMLMIFNNVRNLNVQNLTLLNSPKYCIYWSNLHGPRFQNLTFQGASAAIQGLGFGLDVQGFSVEGTSADDFIAWTNDNDGYTQFDFPNINSFGPLVGFTWRDTACHHTRANVFGIYQGINSVEISGVLLDGIQCTQAPVRYVYVDGGPYATTGTRDITVKNIRGQQPLDSFIRIGGVSNGLTVDSLFMERFDVGSAIWTTTPFFISNNVTINKVFIDGKGSAISMDSTASQRYFFQASASATLPDIEITGFTLTNSAGAAGSYFLQHNGAQKLVRIYNNRFYGTATSMYGTPTGSPTIILENNYCDSYPILAFFSDAFYTVRNNKFGDSISIACIYGYNGSYTANLRCYNNDWGGSGTWLALYDTFTLNLWWGGNYARAGFGTSIGFNGSNTVNLRASDAALPVNASKFSSIDAGCVLNNNNATVKPGLGIITQDGTSLGRLKPYAQTVASSATPALDCNLGNVVAFTATSAATWGAPTNVPPAGQTVQVVITQNATGGFAITWNAAYIFHTAFTNAGNTANKKTNVFFVSDGTSLIAQAPNVWY